MGLKGLLCNVMYTEPLIAPRNLGNARTKQCHQTLSSCEGLASKTIGE